MAPAHPGRFQPTIVTEEPLNAFLRTTADCLIVLEAFERHMIPRIHRRLREPERRRFIRSGAVFVFDEKESEIKRWTDGFSWSPSRILGNFLVYREISPTSRRSGSSSDSESSPNDNTSERSALDKEVYGSLKSHQNFKPGGLMKRTISVVIKERTIHVVCYYNPEDVIAGRLMTPAEMPHLRGLLSVVHPELLQRTLYRFPPLVQLGPDGIAITSPPSAHPY
ncbi:hypothetical protein BOTBODRAFT_59327 [Botryobasidium botryosum FD-172 SS1]|uniref:Uncharacterized protein n=1 Tax=Botryobasidium botryosum (strain FD-172 SS1) TaxID=930990 RepID=A0A067LYI3_BOTB1|nr:hypothetical protein BOTBODRAFT_59327 [Botryobasidium botryosum FD-172 SS1]